MKSDIVFKIRKIREIKGFSQEYMASKRSILQRSQSKIENNDPKIDWAKIEIISKILDSDSIDSLSLDDNLFFNNYSQSGKFQVFNKISRML